jgi:hypothetical protein
VFQNGILKIKDAMLKSNLMKNKIYYMLETPKALSTLILVKILRMVIDAIPNGQSAGNQN